MKSFNTISIKTRRTQKFASGKFRCFQFNSDYKIEIIYDGWNKLWTVKYLRIVKEEEQRSSYDHLLVVRSGPIRKELIKQMRLALFGHYNPSAIKAMDRMGVQR